MFHDLTVWHPWFYHIFRLSIKVIIVLYAVIVRRLSDLRLADTFWSWGEVSGDWLVVIVVCMVFILCIKMFFFIRRPSGCFVFFRGRGCDISRPRLFIIKIVSICIQNCIIVVWRPKNYCWWCIKLVWCLNAEACCDLLFPLKMWLNVA